MKRCSGRIRIVSELFDQIEKDVGRERLQFLAQKIDIVVDGEMLGRVAERAERAHDIGFGLPFFRFQFIAEILINRGRTCAVEEHQDFEFLFHDCVVSVIPTEVEESLSISAKMDVREYSRDVSIPSHKATANLSRRLRST